jgi:hypothetical protein
VNYVMIRQLVHRYLEDFLKDFFNLTPFEDTPLMTANETLVDVTILSCNDLRSHELKDC